MNISKYQVEGPANLKIAFAADLHEREPEEVVNCIKEIQPDLILLSGDMLERHSVGIDPRVELFNKTASRARKIRNFITGILLFWLKYFFKEEITNHENTYVFLEEVAKIAPVYMSVGNHEWYYAKEDYEAFKKAGVTLLDNESILWNGINIGGLSPAYDLQWLDSFNKLSGYKILLSHHPEYYKPFIAKTSIDLILSGHAHGGQIRIHNQGIWAPGQGFFPKYDKGLFEGRFVVTSGCSNTAKFPRWGNPCEVVEINVVKTDSK